MMRKEQLETKKSGEISSHPISCGKTGIRTLEPLWAATRFPDAPLQPLEHLSILGLQIYEYFFSLQYICFPLSGDGRTRTAVQTKSQWAFYTLILPLIVGTDQPEDGQIRTYPLKLDAV